ncbi:cysteine-rich receptor-like protein kinase 44 [Oryza glaberrima]|uniref:cysteine-rich receptor-like protein kinase 44 n=1 Tax=Oryza glaberrima TaxID=4538 RepID=UPI00224BFDFB|nr:cysteine-rich receptor-like protein kinase 44 [Oryza glaberrima]
MEFTFHLIEEITNKFSDKQKIGEGGYGKVYKGVHNGKEIAVKKLNLLPGLNDTVFKNESLNLMSVQHQNIVKLIGYCYETKNKVVEYNGKLTYAEISERVICFEYLKRGNLANFISDESGGGLDWTTRYRIIKGACEGLNYLHNGQEKPIYHLDLKPENILLDENMAPKIADFGLSRLFESTKTHITKTVNGTRGYMPPEFIDQGKITKKFDVFSLGVIIIQIIAGIDGYRQCCDMSSTQEFVDYVYAKWNKRVQGISRYASREADMLAVRQCIELSLRCVEANRDKRPAINDIVHQLNELDAEIENMFMRQPKSLLGQKSSESKYLGLDPVRELRFPFEVKKDISCCLQLTNQTDYFIAFNTKANQKKYSTQPNKGTIAPWSSCYVTVTMKAQETAPPYLQCHDMFVVQSTRVNEDLEPEPEDITEELFKKTMGKVVDEEKLPIVYVALPQAES